MIVRRRPTAFELLFIMRGSILPTIAPRLCIVFAISSLVAWLWYVRPQISHELNPAPFTLIGIALSIFLGFRNNACYERWWEGRKQWGQLVSVSRGVLREFLTVLPEDTALRRRLGRRVVAFAHALRSQLRGLDGDTIGGWLPEGEFARIAGHRSRPDAIMLAQAGELSQLLRRGEISDICYRGLSDRLMVMTDIQTACERLRSTPMPFAYTLLLHRTAWLFCMFLPLGLVGTLGLATPLAATILAYAFFGLDALGEDLEEPFGRNENGLPLDALVRTIEIAVLEALGETDLPPAVTPTRYVLH